MLSKLPAFQQPVNTGSTATEHPRPCGRGCFCFTWQRSSRQQQKSSYATRHEAIPLYDSRMPDKYAATWISHSSLSDFIACPRAYYLKNVYKNPQTGHKMQLIGPALVLGQVVHAVLESRSKLGVAERFTQPLLEQYEELWEPLSGRNGGFAESQEEQRFKARGEQMLRNVMTNPGPLAKLAVKLKVDLPYYWLSEEDEIILCGKIDWLEYLPEEDGVRIIDFKTGKQKEREGSLQLPIYHLLVHNTQHRKVVDACYWYLEDPEGMTVKALPSLEAAHEQVYTLAKQVRLARKLGRFKCPEGEGGCRACQPYEAVLRGEAEYLTVKDRRDVYTLRAQGTDEGIFESELL